MATIRVRAKSDGRIVRWSDLKQSRLVDTSRFACLFFTTTLTDVITDLCALAESLDQRCRIVTVVPNGPTTTALDLALLGKGFEITCSRRLVRGWFPLNPIAAEFGANYDVVVTVNDPSGQVQSQVVELLQSKYACTAIT